MAQLLNSPLGTLKGKVAGFIFKNLNGSTYISSKPLKVKVSATPEAIERREKLSFLSQLHSVILNDFIIKSMWNNSDIPVKTAHNKMMKVNYHLLGTDRNIEAIKLVPAESLFDAALQKIEIEGDYLVLTADPFTSLSISDKFFSEISAHGIMHLSNPSGSTLPPYKFISLTSGSVKFVKDIPLLFRIPIIDQDKFLFDDYSLRNFAVTLIISDINKEPAYCSKSLGGAASELPEESSSNV